MKNLLLVFLFVPAVLFSQSRKQRKALAAQQKADQQSMNNLKSHVQNLRYNATAEASVAKDGSQREIDYISSELKKAGLQPKGSNGYVQQFNFEDEKQIERNTYLKVNEAQLILKKEYFPLAFSASKSAEGMPAMALHEKGVPWFTDMKDWLEENARDTQFHINEAIRKEAARAAVKGATALFVYNSGNALEELQFNNKEGIAPSPIPVIYILPEGYKKYFSDHSQSMHIELNVSIKTISKKGNNLIGYINNSAASTIVIETTYNRAAKPADAGNERTDFASGNSETAMLIELAQMLSASKAKHNNYLFIFYSGEDMGLQGSRYWLNNATVTQPPVNYILYLRNTARYNDDKKLLVSSPQMSASLSDIITKIADKKLEIKTDSVNNSPVAYTFFPKGVPSLTFFTAQMQNNQKALDDESKINYEGELQIVKFIYKLVEATDSQSKFLADKN